MVPPFSKMTLHKNIYMVAMLTRDALLCHFRKGRYHGGISGCALLPLMYLCWSTNPYSPQTQYSKSPTAGNEYVYVRSVHRYSDSSWGMTGYACGDVYYILYTVIRLVLTTCPQVTAAYTIQ